MSGDEDEEEPSNGGCKYYAADLRKFLKKGEDKKRLKIKNKIKIIFILNMSGDEDEEEPSNGGYSYYAADLRKILKIKKKIKIVFILNMSGDEEERFNGGCKSIFYQIIFQRFKK